MKSNLKHPLFATAMPLAKALAVAPFFILAQTSTAGDTPSKSVATAPVVVTDGSVKVKTKPGTTVVVTRRIPPPSSSDSGTLTAGSSTFTCPNLAHNQAIGFGPSLGSYNPTALTGGDTVYVFDDNNQHGACLTNSGRVEISGFSANPGSGWLTSAKCNGVTNTGSTATFSYASGVATWVWSTRFGFVNATVYTCTLVHT